jgi:hypothetical protein
VAGQSCTEDNRRRQKKRITVAAIPTSRGR